MTNMLGIPKVDVQSIEKKHEKKTSKEKTEGNGLDSDVSDGGEGANKIKIKKYKRPNVANVGDVI